MRLSPHELAALKAEHPVEALIQSRIRLGRPNARGIRPGPCLCEPVRGKSPLWVDTARQTWGCLRGHGCGGDIFGYLHQFEGLDFPAAIRRLGGQPISAQARTVDPREEHARKRLERAKLERDRRQAFEIWRRAGPAHGTIVDNYFQFRGLEPPATRSIRFSSAEPYYAPTGAGANPTVVWSGPAMVAAIVGPDRRFMGVHRTWLDPRLASGGLPEGASGKATILSPDGEPLPAKKMRGWKRGGAIRLNDPRYDCGRIVLLIGEGVETTATALQACQHHGAPGDCYVAWAAGDLGNISGGGLGPSAPHPDKPGRWIPSSDPDPDAPGLMPPEWADLVVLLGDGDSDELVTGARLECARRRYEGAGFKTAIAMAPAGCDFNDLARRAAAA